MRTRHLAASVLALASVTALSLSGCSGYRGSSSTSESSITCDDVLTSVLQLVRADDTAGDINSQIDWLSHNCPAEYDVFTEYSSTRVSAAQFGPDTCDSLSQYIGRAAIALLSRDGLCLGGTTGSENAAALPEAQPGGGIAWDQAVDYAGTTQRVCGPLVGDGTSEDDVFLNLGRDYPDSERFQIVLWDVGGVEPIPYGATLCTSGLITLYNGVAQIELEAANQVEVYQ